MKVKIRKELMGNTKKKKQAITKTMLLSTEKKINHNKWTQFTTNNINVSPSKLDISKIMIKIENFQQKVGVHIYMSHYRNTSVFLF